MKKPHVGDYIKTISGHFKTQWKGKIRREDDITGMYLVEWSYTGGLRTDLCTWVFDSDIKVTRKSRN